MRPSSSLAVLSSEAARPGAPGLTLSTTTPSPLCARRHRHRETSEERRARKAARKAEKAADAALLLPEDARQAAAEVAFYSAQDNPFHDANLGDKFVWGKKREKERKMGMTPEEAAKRDRERAYESQVRPPSLPLRSRPLPQSR